MLAGPRDLERGIATRIESAFWPRMVKGLEVRGVVGPINTLPNVFESDQVAARQMKNIPVVRCGWPKL